MQLHTLKRAHPHKNAKRVARGGKRGKTAGRGTKGQKARAGHKMRPEMRDIIKKYPKHRGYKFKAFSEKPLPVNIERLEMNFSDGETVNPETLIAKQVITRSGGRIPSVKILGVGNLTKKLIVSGCAVSASAKAAIERAGGNVVPI